MSKWLKKNWFILLSLTIIIGSISFFVGFAVYMVDKGIVIATYKEENLPSTCRWITIRSVSSDGSMQFTRMPLCEPSTEQPETDASSLPFSTTPFEPN